MPTLRWNDSWGACSQKAKPWSLAAVQQEVLSGVRTPEQFTTLRDFLRGLEDQATTSQDYETAAQFHNVCRRAGVQGSTTDFLLCAVANRLDVPILSSDRDFLRFAEQLPIVLADV